MGLFPSVRDAASGVCGVIVSWEWGMPPLPHFSFLPVPEDRKVCVFFIYHPCWLSSGKPVQMVCVAVGQENS